MHRLLKRQLAKLKIADGQSPDTASWCKLLDRVSTSYSEADQERYLLEHSLEVSSEEMQQLYSELRRTAEASLHEEKVRAKITLQSIGDAVISTDAKGCILFMNDIAESLTGWQLADCAGKNVTLVFRTTSNFRGADQRDSFLVAIKDRKIMDLLRETRLVHRNLEELPIKGKISPILDAQDECLGAVVIFNDITQENELKKKLEHQAHHDMLTGLCNRYSFEQKLAGIVEQARLHRDTHALLYMDLDDFKIINDTCGHLAGDQLLKQLCNLISNHVRKEDTLARLGGDEFALLLEDCRLETTKIVANNILEAVRSFRFCWEEKIFSIGMSMGLVEISENSQDCHTVLSEADMACYSAKEGGRNRIHAFQASDAELALRQVEMNWASRITQAIDDNRFILYRQAVVPIDSGATDGHHYEVLVRMLDEDGSLIPPGVFIPAAERFNIMPAVDRWVIRNTFKTLSENPELLRQTRMCAINLSGNSLDDEQLLDFILGQLIEYRIAPTTVCFEITETAAISELTAARRIIDKLQFHGCRFALDDFGSGLSSFSYLKELPVDFLKIDGRFVKDICDDPVDLAMVSSINHVGHVIGVKTIAEFVENDAILDKLRIVGVDFAQGYGIQKPIPLDSPLPDADSADDGLVKNSA